MSLIVDMLLKEKVRIEYMLEKYCAMLNELPRGTLSERRKNNRTYFYLKYREGKKVITKYLGKECGNFFELIEKRKHVEAMIKSLKKELKIVERALEGNV